MTPENEQKLARACLAALARRAGSGVLVVSYEEIGRELANDIRVEIISDCEAKCVRLWAPEIAE